MKENKAYHHIGVMSDSIGDIRCGLMWNVTLKKQPCISALIIEYSRIHNTTHTKDKLSLRQVCDTNNDNAAKFVLLGKR